MSTQDRKIAKLEERIKAAESFCRFMKERDNFMMNSGMKFFQQSAKLEDVRDAVPYYEKLLLDFEYIKALEQAFYTLTHRIISDPRFSEFLPDIDDALKAQTQMRKNGGVYGR